MNLRHIDRRELRKLDKMMEADRVDPIERGAREMRLRKAAAELFRGCATAGDVAHRLDRLGVAGRIHSPMQCPLAVALRDGMDGYGVEVYGSKAWAGDAFVPLPPAGVEFVEQFDRGGKFRNLRRDRAEEHEAVAA